MLCEQSRVCVQVICLNPHQSLVVCDRPLIVHLFVKWCKICRLLFYCFQIHRAFKLSYGRLESLALIQEILSGFLSHLGCGHLNPIYMSENLPHCLIEIQILKLQSIRLFMLCLLMFSSPSISIGKTLKIILNSDN
jgi:hypothetical protein